MYVKYIGKSSSRKLCWVIYYTLYRTDPKTTFKNTVCCTQISKHVFLHNNINNPKLAQPGFHLGAPKERKVVTKIISYKIYRKTFFQKVALGYLLHFVQNASSRNIFKHTCLHNNLNKNNNDTARLPFGNTHKKT